MLRSDITNGMGSLGETRPASLPTAPVGKCWSDLGAMEARLEPWIVSLLEGRDASRPSTRSTSEVIEALGQFSWRRQAEAGRSGSDQQPVAMAKGNARAERARLKVSRHAKGLAIVRLLVTSLLRESELDELAEALDCLVLSGTRRVLIDFGPVEKMSSQVVAHLASLQRRCSEEADGRLAVCSLQPTLLELFQITGLSKSIPYYADERAALETAWPEASGPAPLPVAVLNALMARSQVPAETKGVAIGATADAADAEVASDEMNETATEAPKKLGTERIEAWLIVLSGPKGGRGRAIRIGSRPLVVGRDPSCQIRSRYEGLSRRHVQFECVGDQVIVRDLGSTNGTIVKGRVLRDEAHVLGDHSRVAIGPLRFKVAIGRTAAKVRLAEDKIIEWLRESDEEGEPKRLDEDTRLDLPRFAGQDSATFTTLRAVVIEGVLVISPRKARLEGDSLLEDLRRDLHALAENPWPHRVVANLVSVDQLSTQTVGLLLAHALGLERRGGSLRLCQVNPRVLAVLERIKLPQIIETFNNLDDAVLSKWS
jgi:anti-anti-sigma factor